MVGSAPITTRAAGEVTRLGPVRVVATIGDDGAGLVEVDVEVIAPRRLGAADTPVAVVVTLRAGEPSDEPAGQQVLARQRVDLDLETAPAEHVRVLLVPDTVPRWWPRALGRPDVTELSVELVGPDGALLHHWQRTVGFRTVELDTDADDVGAPFTVVVNGVRLFARGVAVSAAALVDDDTAEHVADLVLGLGADLVRLVDGVAPDAFYDRCDRDGVLVWQDLTSPSTSHRSDEQILTDVHHQVLHLHSHPCLALWNGGAGGQAHEACGRTGSGLFSDDVPLVIDELDPVRPYWPGTPYSGPHVAANADAHGCSHVTDGWDRRDHRRVRDRTSRFVAQVGWPATGAGPDAAFEDASGAAFEAALEAWWPGATSSEQRELAAQLLQARAASTAVEHFRSLHGWCMGTVWSHLVDADGTWSLVDAQRQPLPAWHAVRGAFADHLLTVQPRGHQLVLVAVNDARRSWWVKGTVTRLSLDGTVLRSQPIDLMVGRSTAARAVIDPCVASPRDPAGEVLVVEAGGTTAWWWFDDLLPAPGGTSPLPRPTFTVDGARDGRRVRLSVTSSTVVRDLVLRPHLLVPGTTVDRALLSLRPGVPQELVIDGLPAGEEPPAAAWFAAPVAVSAADLR